MGPASARQSGLRLAHAFDVAEGIVVLAVERAVGGDHDAVHRADATRERIDPVDDVERGLLVRMVRLQPEKPSAGSARKAARRPSALIASGR